MRFSRDVYDDIVRGSHGQLDPSVLAESQVRALISSSLEFGTLGDVWAEEHREELVEKYAPHLADAPRTEADPLVWKEVTIAAGSSVRMSYDGEHHYATVKGGMIVEDGTEYSPSEWASKVAGGTSRNAWRDLWLKEPLSNTWVPAQLLREQAQKEQLAQASPALALLNELHAEMIERDDGTDNAIFGLLADKVDQLRRMFEGRSELVDAQP
jgi:hypothetical protein